MVLEGDEEREEGESWGVEWFPRRIMEGRAEELDARLETACVRGSTNTSAVSTTSLRVEPRVVGDWPGARGLNRLRACSAPESESSSESLSSEVSRSSIALWID